MSVTPRTKEVQQLLRKILLEKKGRRVSEKTLFAFVFHMTDWLDDLSDLSSLYSSPGKYSVADGKRIVDGFLCHAAGHIVQAARTWDLFSDPFGEDREPRKKAVAARKTISKRTGRARKPKQKSHKNV